MFTIHKAEEIKSYVECDAERKVVMVILQYLFTKMKFIWLKLPGLSFPRAPKHVQSSISSRFPSSVWL